MAKYIATSIFDLFKIGPGPSSSHTIGPMKAALRFRQAVERLPVAKLKTATAVEAHLYGSLSATGKGHGTDRAITAGLLGWQPRTCDCKALANLLKKKKDSYTIKVKNNKIHFSSRNIHFDSVKHSYPFNNTLIIRLKSGKRVLLEKEYYSVGGGFIKSKGEAEPKRPRPPYRYANMAQLKQVLHSRKVGIISLILENEQALTGMNRRRIYQRIDEILSVMEDSVNRGIRTKGFLPGPIHMARKAPALHRKAKLIKHIPERFFIFLDAYALATSEENASGHKVVTAPTSGSAGVLPAILYLIKHHFHVSKQLLREGVLIAAVIGFIIKHNASIAGAEVGCQGEIGSASSMAAGLLAYLKTGEIDLVENAAEIALEHHLGMTCDPVGGYVQIPCIERNAVAAIDAYNAYLLASVGDPKKQKLKLDQVVEAMLETGRDMSKKYKETSKGGLAVCTITC